MFEFRDGSLHAESVPLEAIAREFGTPCYVYSRAALAAALSQFQSACGGHGALVCYAMKANSDLAILNLFAGMGVEFDAALELYREASRLPQIEVIGIDCHIGSNRIEYAPLMEALDKMLGLVDRLAAEGIRLRHVYELQLQQPAAHSRGHGGRGEDAPDPRA